MATTIPDPITAAEVARICRVSPVTVLNWRKAGTGPSFEPVAVPGCPPRNIYSRRKVEAFARDYRPQKGRPTTAETMAKRVEALAARVEALEREKGGRVKLEARLAKLEKGGRVKVRRAKLGAGP